MPWQTISSFVDMQNDFVSGSLGTLRSPNNDVEAVARRAEEFEGTVVFTKDTHDEDYLQTQEGAKLPVTHCVRDTPGWS